MKFSILLEMLTDLLRKHHATAEYFSEKFNISARTVYRYVEVLKTAFPITVKRGRSGGIYLSDAFKLPVGYLTQEDLKALHESLENAYAQTGDERFLRTERKIEREAKAPEGIHRFTSDIDEMFVDGAGFECVYSLSDKLRLFGQCIQEHFVTDVCYVNENEDELPLRLEPHALVLRKNIWYVYAFCHQDFDFRMIPVGRCVSILKWEVRFQKRLFNEDDLGFTTAKGKRVNVQLELKPEFVSQAIEILGAENVRWFHEKRIAEIDMPDDDSLVSKLLSLGNGVKVLSPTSLQEKIRKHAEEILQTYTP